MSPEPRRLLIDTDTAGDDTQAIVLAALSDRVTLEGLTIPAGNVPFDSQVENAKYTLDLVGAADVPVYEGARSPLLKGYKSAEYVHGEGGLGGELFPDTGIPSADEHAVDVIVRTARENPGEVTLACIAPLTNVALAYQREPELPELLDEVWIMGGAVNTLGNITPAAEYNFWVDPDAARIVVDAFETTLVDWGLTLRDSLFDAEVFAEIETVDTPLAEFFLTITGAVREFNAQSEHDSLGADVTTQPDSLTLAALLEPDLVERAETYYMEVDDREGPTRGYSLVDELGVTDGEPRTRVIESADGEGFERMLLDVFRHGDPHYASR
ncbi:nucleoside hydrolase [Halalkalicoccus jeotgali]|uniref:Inosine-uridine preferring nucleoside hydrolase n=1 Tax=Halalkalicoccus jeotgali (strain DSM 18796 / CECT 7217 / JCM 14584 / KCTC 4019 / B3) TaxID=795797 RepID=D8J7K8_HALJB|nr:nucleoside hydrolase [Halalkalicoccus jeotgali]ADJ16028.1 inosine-uridine preferring nucleoside hydrolase [Halalkalicoccus jeotgali B3]ELY38124.1 inosine-uridine preferring nucleoside hydrolase [Halalkalicoccus jeotgali B3]